MKPRIWKSRHGYWICHGINRYGIPMQGYGNTPANAWINWFRGLPIVQQRYLI